MVLLILLMKTWKRWLKIAKVIGNFQSQVILTIFYFIIIAPLGVYYRFFSDEFRFKIAHKKNAHSNFQNWQHLVQNLEEAKRQF